MTAAEQRAEQLGTIAGRLELLTPSELLLVEAVIDGLARGRSVIMNAGLDAGTRVATWLGIARSLRMMAAAIRADQVEQVVQRPR